MAAGRPKKYTKKGLREAIERYFRSISRKIPARDDTGGIIRNDDGEEIKVVQFVVPPSVTGMCLYLGIDRSTWQNYADAALHPELAGICQGARTRIEAYLEQELLTREKGVQGIIFNLQNNYGGTTGGGNISGVTDYDSAIAYMKAAGVDGSVRSGLMTKSEWSRRKASMQQYGTGGTEVKNYNSYADYIKDYCEYAASK